MLNIEEIEQQWEELVLSLSERFADSDRIRIDSIIYLIGVQELGKGVQEFSKDDKLNLMHIAVCKLLEPYDYYEFSHRDSDGWPHYNLLKELPNLKPEEQTTLMKKAIIGYFSS